LLVVKIWNFLRGFVYIKVEGLSLEKFINYAISRGVYLWDVNRIDYTTLEAKVGLEGYKELRHIVKKAGCRVKIHEKIGYPFFMHKIRGRKMFSIGFIISFLLIIMGSSFIWTVEIVGNDKMATSKIENYLVQKNLHPGVYKYNINLTDIENSMMIELEDLAWVGIHIKGTKAIVDIVEKVIPPQRVPLDEPCDIIAVKNGIVEKVIAKNGDALVVKGSIVKEGEALITGLLMRENMPIRYVHALGEVYGRTFYEEKDEMSLIKNEKIETGNRYKRRILKIGNSQIALSFGEIPYTSVIMKKRNKTIPGWRNIRIPVEIIIEEYFEVIEKSSSIERSVAKKALKDKIMVKLINKIPVNAKIIDQNLKFYDEEDKIRVELTIEALEQIGAQRRIIPIE